jgi:hypothetical protein
LRNRVKKIPFTPFRRPELLEIIRNILKKLQQSYAEMETYGYSEVRFSEKAVRFFAGEDPVEFLRRSVGNENSSFDMGGSSFDMEGRNDGSDEYSEEGGESTVATNQFDANKLLSEGSFLANDDGRFLLMESLFTNGGEAALEMNPVKGMQMYVPDLESSMAGGRDGNAGVGTEDDIEGLSEDMLENEIDSYGGDANDYNSNDLRGRVADYVGRMTSTKDHRSSVLHGKGSKQRKEEEEKRKQKEKILLQIKRERKAVYAYFSHSVHAVLLAQKNLQTVGGGSFGCTGGIVTEISCGNSNGKNSNGDSSNSVPYRHSEVAATASPEVAQIMADFQSRAKKILHKVVTQGNLRELYEFLEESVNASMVHALDCHTPVCPHNMQEKRVLSFFNQKAKAKAVVAKNSGSGNQQAGTAAESKNSSDSDSSDAAGNTNILAFPRDPFCYRRAGDMPLSPMEMLRLFQKAKKNHFLIDIVPERTSFYIPGPSKHLIDEYVREYAKVQEERKKENDHWKNGEKNADKNDGADKHAVGPKNRHEDIGEEEHHHSPVDEATLWQDEYDSSDSVVDPRGAMRAARAEHVKENSHSTTDDEGKSKTSVTQGQDSEGEKQNRKLPSPPYATSGMVFSITKLRLVAKSIPVTAKEAFWFCDLDPKNAPDERDEITDSNADAKLHSKQPSSSISEKKQSAKLTAAKKTTVSEFVETEMKLKRSEYLQPKEGKFSSGSKSGKSKTSGGSGDKSDQDKDINWEKARHDTDEDLEWINNQINWLFETVFTKIWAFAVTYQKMFSVTFSITMYALFGPAYAFVGFGMFHYVLFPLRQNLVAVWQMIPAPVQRLAEAGIGGNRFVKRK